jgi:hypothetical protein
MKQIFKKTILAAAIAGLSNYAVAGEVLNDTLEYSTEGLKTLAPDAEKTIESVVYELGANYIASDEITITFSPAGSLSSFDADGYIIAEGDVEGDSITFSLLSQTDDSVTFRVTAVTDNYDTTGTEVDFGAALLNVSSILADDVSVTYSSIKAGSDAAFDEGSEGSNTGVLTSTASQISAITVTEEFDAVIDVDFGRTDFTSDFENEDSMTFEIENNTDLEDSADFTDSSVVFELQMTGEDMMITSDSDLYDYSDVEGDIVTIYYNGAVTTDTITVSHPPGSSALIAQEFSVSAEYFDGDADEEGEDTFSAGEDVPAGEWTLNGNVVNIPYMPFAPGISQILYVTNSGDFDGGVYVTAYDEDGTEYDLGMVATAGASSVTKITAQVKDALAAQDFTKGKLSIDVTVNAPDGDITVQAAYNIGSDRGFVITDQYKKSDTYEMMP